MPRKIKLPVDAGKQKYRDFNVPSSTEDTTGIIGAMRTLVANSKGRVKPIAPEKAETKQLVLGGSMGAYDAFYVIAPDAREYVGREISNKRRDFTAVRSQLGLNGLHPDPKVQAMYDRREQLIKTREELKAKADFIGRVSERTQGQIDQLNTDIRTLETKIAEAEQRYVIKVFPTVEDALKAAWDDSVKAEIIPTRTPVPEVISEPGPPRRTSSAELEADLEADLEAAGITPPPLPPEPPAPEPRQSDSDISMQSDKSRFRDMHSRRPLRADSSSDDDEEDPVFEFIEELNNAGEKYGDESFSALQKRLKDYINGRNLEQIADSIGSLFLAINNSQRLSDSQVFELKVIIEEIISGKFQYEDREDVMLWKAQLTEWVKPVTPQEEFLRQEMIERQRLKLHGASSEDLAQSFRFRATSSRSLQTSPSPDLASTSTGSPKLESGRKIAPPLAIAFGRGRAPTVRSGPSRVAGLGWPRGRGSRSSEPTSPGSAVSGATTVGGYASPQPEPMSPTPTPEPGSPTGSSSPRPRRPRAGS